MRISAIFAAAVLVGLTACTDTTSQKVTPKAVTLKKVPIDISTPDNALKTYWAVIDSIMDYRFAKQKEYEASGDDKRVESQRKLVAEEEISNWYLQTKLVQDSYSREISEVKIESESRAVITTVIKNTSPLPEGAEMDARSLNERIQGERYRYVMGHHKSGWRVSEVYSWQSYSSSWRKDLPFDKKPIVPSMTFSAR
jgi:hypothetical protein